LPHEKAQLYHKSIDFKDIIMKKQYKLPTMHVSPISPTNIVSTSKKEIKSILRTQDPNDKTHYYDKGVSNEW